MNKIDRRSFLKTMSGTIAAAGAATVLAGCGSSTPNTDSASTAASASAAGASGKEYTFADTIRWDAEYDVAVLGMGFSGMVSALSAANAGASVVVLEKASEAKAGGNSKVCGQLFAWAEDFESSKAYLHAMACGKAEDEDLLDVMAQGIVDMPDRLANTYKMDSSLFKDWSDTYLAFISPEYPELAGSDKVSIWSTHDGRNDAFLYKHIKSLIADNTDSIDVWYSSPAVDLIQDPVTKTVVGVSVTRDGKELNVRAKNGVCVCTGGFENNAQMIKTYLNRVNCRPYGGLYNTGDGIQMCKRAGCDLKNMAAYEGGFATGGASFITPEGDNASGLTFAAAGSAMVIGTDGQRLFNETEVVRHGHMYSGNLIWDNPHYAEKNWVVFDQKFMDKNSSLIPEEYVTGFESHAAAAEYMGMPAEKLDSTINDFNYFIKAGRDYELGRNVSTMEALTGEALYVVPVLEGILNTQGGPRRNCNAEILDTKGEPIPHLYSAGEMGGFTTMMYQGGCNVAECFIMGEIAGKNAASVKSELPVYEALEQVDSTPAQLGEIDDQEAADETWETGENQYIGIGEGMNGEVVVRVTVDSDKKVTAIEVLKQNETEGIGTKAIPGLQDAFNGLTADEVEAVDVVSGATVTSKAIKAAVQNALESIQ